MAIARFSVAVDRRFKKQDDNITADFFNCTSFGKQAEFVEKYLRKGTKITLTGRIQNDNYTNKNGEKVYAVQIIAEEIEFAESRGNSSASEQKGVDTESSVDGFMNIPDAISEELPFN